MMRPHRLSGASSTAVLDFSWALKLLASNPELFDLSEYLTQETNRETTVRSGQLWFAMPEGSFVRLCDDPDAPTRQCPGVIKDGRWNPLPEEPPGPMAMKLVFIEAPGADPDIDPWHKRPGIVLGDPHAHVENAPNATTRSAALLGYDRAVWIVGQTPPIDQHGQLNVVMPGGEKKHYHFWRAWGISAKHGRGLLCPTPDRDLSLCRSQYGSSPLLPKATAMLAEALGLRPWRGTRLPPVVDEWPERGEVVLVSFGPPGTPSTPCLVVSPSALNMRNDLVVLRCIPYKEAHESPHVGIHMPLPGGLTHRRERWTVSLSLVRGIGKARSHWDFCTSRTSRYRLDEAEPKTFETIDRRMRQLYA
jgi:hypothetical protein